MSAFIKVGKYCLEVPAFSELALRRASHGRHGEPFRELARELVQGGVLCPAIVLGAGFGERVADLACAGIRSVLCVEASAGPYAFLERNAGSLGSIALRASIGEQPPSARSPSDPGPAPGSDEPPSLGYSAVLARYPRFEAARLLVVAGNQNGPAAVASALGWIRSNRPLLALEIRIKDSESLERWTETLAGLTALGYQTGLVFDQLDHPLGWLRTGTAELLAALHSSFCHGGGLESATVFLAVGGDRAVLDRVAHGLAQRNSASRAHRIAVVRLDNLGDHVLGAGIFAALRDRYPHSKLVAIVPAPLAELYARCPSVDAILTVPPRAVYLNHQDRWNELVRFLSECSKFDLVVNPRFAEDWYAAGSMCAAIAAPAARVIGFRQEQNPLTNYDSNTCFRELLQAPDTLHTARYAALMAEAATGRAQSTAPQVWFEAEDWDTGARRFGLQSKGFIALGIGASSPHKLPPIEIFRHVIGRLLSKALPVVLVGAASESAFAEALRGAFPATSQIITTVGALRLYEVAALLRHARLYIGPDAGPKHMAAASRTPVLEIAWVPEDFPATSRGQATAGACWIAWDTATRIVCPDREVFVREAQRPDFHQRPLTGIDPGQLERAVDDLLAGGGDFAWPGGVLASSHNNSVMRETRWKS